MGHLIFAGLFLFLIILLICKIYFSYIYAAKRGTNTDEEISVKMGEKEKLFHVKRSIKLFGWVGLFLNMLILIYLFKVLEQKPEASNGLWMTIVKTMRCISALPPQHQRTQAEQRKAHWIRYLPPKPGC